MADDLRVMEVLDATVKAHGAEAAMKVKRGGAWQTTSWKEYQAGVRKTARGFMALGLAPGQGVAIIGYNCPEWFLADVGAIAAGGVPAGIYTTCTGEQCQYIADHCDAPIVVAENAQQLAKFLAVRDRLPKVKAYVVMHGEASGENVHTWAQLLALADTISDEQLDARIAAQKLDDTATLIYTSGTTGTPKAVMITHRNITWVASQTVKQVDTRPGDRIVSYLPLSHIAEQVVSLHTPMLIGACTWFAESMEQLGDNLREIHPNMFLGVPRVWEKIQAKMMAAGAQNSPMKKKIAAWARKKGLAGGYAEQRGEGKPFLYGLANKLVFSKVRERLGLDQCRYLATSAAPISKDTLEFFLSLGLPVLEIYGMSECTGPATISLPNKYRTGKAGFALPGAELKIAEDGEVCMRGKHVFKGYFKDETATAEAIDKDGWLHSGDIGVIDDDGFLRITDRKKDLLITAGGENVAPQLIEGHLKGIAAISQAVVVGDRMKYLAALLTLDPEKIAGAAATVGSPAKDVDEARACERFNAWLQKEIDRVNGGLARVQTIKKWVVVKGDFSVDGGELTPTLKIKRKVVREKYKSEIDSLYV